MFAIVFANLRQDSTRAAAETALQEWLRAREVPLAGGFTEGFGLCGQVQPCVIFVGVAISNNVRSSQVDDLAKVLAGALGAQVCRIDYGNL